MKKTPIILSFVLACGILTHSIPRFYLDTYVHPFSGLQECELAQRLNLLRLAESFCSTICGIYLLMLIVFAVIQIQRNHRISWKHLILFFCLQTGIMATTTIPFALLRPFAYGDYLTPLYATFPVLLLLCILYEVIDILRNGRKKSVN